jgi:hypothetical protein
MPVLRNRSVLRRITACIYGHAVMRDGAALRGAAVARYAWGMEAGL